MNSTTQKIILVVEDERPLLDAVKVKLEGQGFKVITARSVDSAIECLENSKGVSAIWLDHYLLGKENGLDFVIRCKKEGSEHRELPIFLVSNTASPDKVQSYFKLGVDKYYVKAESRLDGIVEDVNSKLSSGNL